MGATASKVDGPLETLDAEQVHGVVAGFGTQFIGAADKMREAGIDGDYLAHASDDDLGVVFEECGLTNKLQQSLLRQKLRKATRAPIVPPPLPPRPISPKDDAPTPPASPKANATAPLRVRVTCPVDGYAGKPIVVQIPDGRKARAAIPDVAPGETFTILVYEGAVSPPRRLFVGAAEKRRKRDEDLMTIRSEFWLASPICHPPPVPVRGTANSYEETHATPQEGRSPPRAPDLANVLVSNRPRNRVF